MSNYNKKYSEEVREFIKENYKDYGLRIIPVIKERYGVEIPRNTMLQMAYREFHLKSEVPQDGLWSEGEINWLKSNAGRYKTRKLMLDALNEEFGNNRTMSAMGLKLGRLGLTTSIVDPEEIEWLRENAPYHNSKILAEMHNKVFQKQRTASGISGIASENGIRILSDPAADFKQRSNQSKRVPVGHCRFEKGHEYIKVKMNEYGDNVDRKTMWVPRARYEYERQYGYKPKRWECVLHLDGDKSNYSKENLYLVPNYMNGYILAYLGKLIEGQPELNKAHILRFEVEKIVNDYLKKHKKLKRKLAWMEDGYEYGEV